MPSWKYVAVHVRGYPRLFSDPAARPIETLLHETVREYESRRYALWPYRPDPAFHAGLVRAVRGFELEIPQLEAAFKLSQDKPDADRLNIIEALAGSPVGEQSHIAELMRCELHGRGAYSELEPIPLAPCALLDSGGER